MCCINDERTTEKSQRRMLKPSCVSRIQHQLSVAQKVENVFTLVIKTCYVEKVTRPMLNWSYH